jgi:hypothetical protein
MREERNRCGEQQDEQDLGHDVSEISRSMRIVMTARGLRRV